MPEPGILGPGELAAVRAACQAIAKHGQTLVDDRPVTPEDCEEHFADAANSHHVGIVRVRDGMIPRYVKIAKSAKPPMRRMTVNVYFFESHQGSSPGFINVTYDD